MKLKNRLNRLAVQLRAKFWPLVLRSNLRCSEKRCLLVLPPTSLLVVVKLTYCLYVVGRSVLSLACVILYGVLYCPMFLSLVNYRQVEYKIGC